MRRGGENILTLVRAWESGSAVRLTVLVAAVTAADLVTKALAEARLDDPVALGGGFEFRLGHNSGVAFGFLDSAPSWALAALALGCGALAVYVFARSGLRGAWVALGLLLGGALANLLDRVADGRVTDFLDPPRWPAFNVADIAITVGAALFVLASFREDTNPGKPAPG